ncbi:MAG: beta-class carbonic anhydrase [Clostridia bacterium]
MKLLTEILRYNEDFVHNKDYEKYQTNKFPNKKLVVLSCMDTRLVELLPQAMNLKNGDFKLIKSAGAVISHPFGSIMRSILVAIYELDATEVLIIGHHDCGMSNIHADKMIENMKERGISKETFSILHHSGIHLEKWLQGFDCVQEAVRGSVDMVKNHPLLPPGISVHGLIIDPHTGKLDLVENGYECENGQA